MSEQREILFRGRKKDGAEWFYGDLVHNALINEYCVFPFAGLNSADYYRVNPFTVGQYTGLKDKNGNRIYEGDIMHGHIDCLSAEPDRIGCVEWGNYGWIISFNQPEWRIPRVGFGSFADYEVIGNIHDNPELLEEAKQHE